MPVQSTLQHVYATNLDQQLGYPLRNPNLLVKGELLEPYRSKGLQIGDIGHVDEYGAFNLLFHVKFPPEDELGKPSELQLPDHFDEPLASQKLQPDEVFKTGVTQTLNDGRADAPQAYRFVAKAKKGSILILPTGAELFELEREHLTNIRNHVKKYALAWCKHAQRDTLYLITAVYRAKSWTLGSFKNGVSGEEIRVQVLTGGKDGDPKFRWHHAFNVDNQQVPPGNTDLNQAVFIKGFKMTTAAGGHRVEQLITSGRWFDRLLATLQSTAKKWRAAPKIKYIPELNFSEPSHPLDVVNRILLDKNPRYPVAITHDDDWIEMTKNKLPFEKLMEKCYVRNFMDENYSYDLDSENNTVCLLRHNSEDKTDIQTRMSHNVYSEGADSERKPYELLESPGDIEVPAENSRLVITHMRLESFEIGYVDAGVCVLVQFGTTTRRTENKPYASIVEWDGDIALPSNGPVEVTVCGTFQLGSTLGTRKISAKRTINTNEMPGSAYNLKFSVGNAESRSSLLITLQRHYSDCEAYFNLDEDSDFTQTTADGFKALYSYHEEIKKHEELMNNEEPMNYEDHREHEDLKKEHLDCALKYFRSARQQCGAAPERHATACFNLATSEFIQCQANGMYSKFNGSIDLYREALALRGDGHQDRPATLLLLAQTLLSHHGQEYDEFVVEEIEQLLTELPPDESRDRRSADAILATCRFYHDINAGNTADIDGLLVDFERGAYTPPYGYFDRPHMLHKLGFAFWRRFRSLEKLDDLDRAIKLNAEALQVPSGHDDRNNIAACLGNSLLCALEARGELTDIDPSIGLLELGKKVNTILDDTSYTEGTSVPSEDLQEQIELRFAVAQLREQIQLMSSVERVRQAAAGDAAFGGNPSSKVENPLEDWNRDEDTEAECKRRLGVLLSFLGGEGDRKMREALEQVNPEWPHRVHKIVATMQALEEHMPYYYTVLARRLRFVVEGWC